MRTKQLKKLLKEQGFEQVFSLDEYEKSFKESPTRKVWFQHPLCKYWCINTANSNYYGFHEEFSGYTIGKFHVDIDDEKSTLKLFLTELFGTVKDVSEQSLFFKVRDREQFDKWWKTIA